MPLGSALTDMRRFALLFAVVAAGWVVASPRAGLAREFGPTTTPKAKYVAPLAPWPAPSYRAKDFTIVEWGGQFHLIYTRIQRHVPFHAGAGPFQVLNETSFGHAVSNDLETWTELDTILPIRPGAWDQHHVWAPSIVVQGSVAYLFYGGVTDSLTGGGTWIPRFQRIGMAMSAEPGLNVWFRGPQVWQPCAGGGLPGVPWATCSPIWMVGTADFRDPFVLEADPKVPGSPFHLLYTARPDNDQFNYVAGLAQAASPTSGWSDVGALWDTHYPPGNSKVESPHMFRRGDDLHLFFSGDDGTNGIVWMTSAGSPLGPWTNRGTLRSRFGPSVLDAPYSFPLEVEAWFASEHFRRVSPSGAVDYFSSVHAYDAPAAYNPPAGPPEDISIIEFRELIWKPDGTFTFGTPNPVRSMAWSSSRALPGATVKLRLTSEGVQGRSADLLVSVIRGTNEVQLPPGSVGLPASVALSEGLTELTWVVPSFGTWLPLDVKVRVASQPLAVTSTLRLISWGTGGGGGSDLDPLVPFVTVPSTDSHLAPLAAADVPHELAFRLVSGGSPSGGGYAFALDLPEAGRVKLEMFDVRGRRVCVVLDEDRSAGQGAARWDGRDERGGAVSRGIYFARLTTPFGVRSLRLLHFGG